MAPTDSPNSRKPNPRRMAVAGAIAGAVIGSLGIAAAQTVTSTTTPTEDSTTTTAAPDTAQSTTGDSSTTTAPAASSTTPGSSAAPKADTGSRAGETALTGDVADKVKAAALAAVPGGTVDRVETDSDGSPYEAHVTKPDGSRVTVKVDSNFKVTSIDESHGGGHHGGGRGDETALTGDAADKVKAAALGAVPGGTVDRVETDSGGSPYEAHVTKPDGSRVTVKVDSNFKVTSVDTEPAGHDGRHGPHDQDDTQGSTSTTTNA